MTNLIRFPTSNEHDADRDLGQFFAASTVRDDTPMIDPGFATRLAAEITSAAQRRRRPKRALFFGPGLASAALVALILGGMFAMMGSPGQNQSVSPAPLISSACDAQYRTPTDIENLAFIATIDGIESIAPSSVETSSAESSDDFSAIATACVLVGLHPMMLLSFGDEYVLYVFDRAFQRGISPQEIQEWARSIAEPLTTEEQADLVNSLTKPGIDEFLEAPQWTTYNAATIKPTPEPRCYAGIRSSDDMVAIVQNEAVFEQLGRPSETKLFTLEFSIQHIYQIDGNDYFAELSACIRAGHHPLATTYFDGFYVRELFLRYAAIGASYAEVSAFAQSIALDLDRDEQVAYLSALSGARYETYIGATLLTMSFPAAANERSFVPAIGAGFADRNDPLTPPDQHWRIIDDIILAPVDEIDRRWELPFDDPDFVTPPWMELPSTS